MEYHYRFFADGRCEILCTRCFLKIGEGTEPALARAQAAKHVCPLAPGQGIVIKPSTEIDADAVRARFLTRERFHIPAPLLILFTVAACYGLPTVAEWAILRYGNLWMGAVLLGDLCGCIGIFAVLKRKRLAVSLYMTLTVVELWLSVAQLVSVQVLVYTMDLVPTAILALAVLRPRRVALFRAAFV